MGRAANATPKEREAMPDSLFCGEGHTFPIEDADDIRSAAHLIGKATDKQAVIACILRKAKHIDGGMAAVPDDWLPKKDAEKAAAPITRHSFLLDMDIKSTTLLPDGTLVLTGYASTFGKDRDRQTFSPQGFAKAIPGYLRNPVLLFEHEPKKVLGKVVQAVMDTTGIFIEAHVFPPPDGTEPWHVKAYSDLKNGVLRAFSVGGIFDRVKNAIVGLDWCETSVVSIPANPSTLFEVAQKSFELPANWTAAFGGTAERMTHPTVSATTVARVQRATVALRDVLATHDS